MNEELLELLNKQINLEFYTSYLYYAMSTYFDEIMMGGFSLFMKHKASSELSFAQKMYDYLILRDEKLSFLKIEEVDSNWIDVSDIFINVLSQEQKQYDEIQKLYITAKKHNDIGLMDFLSDIIFQKTKSLSIARKILFRLKNSTVLSSGIELMDRYINKI